MEEMIEYLLSIEEKIDRLQKIIKKIENEQDKQKLIDELEYWQSKYNIFLNKLYES